MTLDVHGFDGQAKFVEPAPQAQEAAPAAFSTAPPQETPAASVQTDEQPQGTPAPQAVPSTPVRAFGRDFASAEQLEAYTRHIVKSTENRNRAELEALRAAVAQQHPAQPSPAATPEPTAPQGAYDVETFKLVKERFGEDAAEDYRSRAIAEHQVKVAEELVSSRIAPFEQSRAQASAEEASTRLFADAIAARGQDGRSPLLPELAMPGPAEEIVKIWQQFPLEYAMTPKAIWDATMIYRGAVRPSFAATPPPPVPQPSGQSIDASHATPPAFVPGTPQPSNIPRPSAVNPATGERYAR